MRASRTPAHAKNTTVIAFEYTGDKIVAVFTIFLLFSPIFKYARLSSFSSQIIVMSKRLLLACLSDQLELSKHVMVHLLVVQVGVVAVGSCVMFGKSPNSPFS